MKREVERERNLPAFSIGIDDLEALLERLLILFAHPEKVYCSITITLPAESLEFSTIKELKQYGQLRGRITKFSLWMSQDNRRITIRSGPGFGFPAMAAARAETEAWCAGAIETAYSFLRSHRVWYHWFLSVPIGWPLVLIMNTPALGLLFLPNEPSLRGLLWTACLAVSIPLAILYFAKATFLPSCSLRMTEEEGFIRRYAAELTFIIGIITALLTVIGWFVVK